MLLARLGSASCVTLTDSVATIVAKHGVRIFDSIGAAANTRPEKAKPNGTSQGTQHQASRLRTVDDVSKQKGLIESARAKVVLGLKILAAGPHLSRGEHLEQGTEQHLGWSTDTRSAARLGHQNECALRRVRGTSTSAESRPELSWQSWCASRAAARLLVTHHV